MLLLEIKWQHNSYHHLEHSWHLFLPNSPHNQLPTVSQSLKVYAACSQDWCSTLFILVHCILCQEFHPQLYGQGSEKNVGKERRNHSTQRYSPTTTAKLADTTSVNEMPTNASEYCMEMLPRQSANPPPIANATDGPLSCIVITTALSSNRGTTATLPIFFFFFWFPLT